MDFVQFFWFPNALYRIVGYDFQQLPRAHWRKALMKAFLIFTTISGICTRIYMLFQLRELILSGDILNSFRLGVYISYAIDSNVKFFVFLLNAKRLRVIYQSLSNEYPMTSMEQKLYQVDKYSFKRARIMIVSYLSVTNSILIGPMLQSIFMYIIDLFRYGYAAAAFSYLHPTPMSYNFNYCTPHYYILIYISEYLNGHFCTTTNLGTDLYVCTFAGQFCMQLEYLGSSLEAYEPSMDNSKADCKFLMEWIRKHQLMLDLCSELNEVFGTTLLFKLISNCAVFCIIVVQLKLEGFGFGFLNFLSFFFVTVAQFFMVCQYGQKLITISENLALCAYKNRWYNGSQTYKTLLFNIIARAQKPARLTAKGFQPISLATFQIVMTMTYRVFAVLQRALD
ncbi:odorant receptor 49a [Bactrocera dorsalis]|uniref:Odorant receptor n=2 Tax=Bactrocera dorsalis TaxID=27457 RepID=A0A6M9TYX1_BACDO|nr:odorant receptor 49a [Bactrocera dorsalis]QKN21253.1 odorant receptor [Bactrocera dorsalis]QKN21368.1 odorant receptor [Bactrocera dorsalis]